MKVYLIDTMNLFHRAFWGNEPLKTSYGLPVQGLYGFCKMVYMILDDHKPDLVIFALESKTKNLRKQKSSAYKANRQELPEDLKTQLNMLPELLSGFGYPAISVDGYEGDDVIASLCEKYKENNEVYIVSGDKDFNQLVSNTVKIYDISKDTLIGPSDVYIKYGISPEQFIDYLAIVGDTSDNIKGIDGIGPKGAVKLLNDFGSLNAIYKNIDHTVGKTKEKLIKSHDQVFLAKDLVTMEKSLNIEVPLMKVDQSKEELKKVFKKLEFNSLYDRVELNSTNVAVGTVDWT
jgi:DNA polymerase-1